MGDINDMITNIAKGDLAKAHADFEDVLGGKIADRLDQHRAYVANSIFNGVEYEEEDPELAELEDVLDDLDSDDEDDYEGEYDDDVTYDDDNDYEEES